MTAPRPQSAAEEITYLRNLVGAWEHAWRERDAYDARAFEQLDGHAIALRSTLMNQEPTAANRALGHTAVQLRGVVDAVRAREPIPVPQPSGPPLAPAVAAATEALAQFNRTHGQVQPSVPPAVFDPDLYFQARIAAAEDFAASDITEMWDERDDMTGADIRQYTSEWIDAAAESQYRSAHIQRYDREPDMGHLHWKPAPLTEAQWSQRRALADRVEDVAWESTIEAAAAQRETVAATEQLSRQARLQAAESALEHFDVTHDQVRRDGSENEFDADLYSDVVVEAAGDFMIREGISRLEDYGVEPDPHARESDATSPADRVAAAMAVIDREAVTSYIAAHRSLYSVDPVMEHAMWQPRQLTDAEQDTYDALVAEAQAAVEAIQDADAAATPAPRAESGARALSDVLAAGYPAELGHVPAAADPAPSYLSRPDMRAQVTSSQLAREGDGIGR